MISLSRIVFLLLISCSLLGCKVKYSFTGASIPENVNTLSLDFFKNQAALAPSNLSQLLTQGLQDAILSQTRLSLVTQNGDVHFSGKITSYNVQSMAVQSDQTAALNRLTINVQVDYINTKDDSQNFQQQFSRFTDYESSQNLSSVQEDLINEINEQLIQDIINRAFSNW